MPPNENFSTGVYQVDIPELGQPIRGKVRENWVLRHHGIKTRVMVTTDRQWSYVREICTIPGKGQISNLSSAFWFEKTKDIVPNCLIAVPHPNVLIARQAKQTLPVEVIVRKYLVKGTTPTSLYVNYFEKGRRNIYGIEFPDGLIPNQILPMRAIVTPTTKAADGHDQELTDEEARMLVDRKLGVGVWSTVKVAALAIVERASKHCLERGLLLADTKMEFGIDDDGRVMLIDEVLTPDCSRFLLANGDEFWPRKDTLVEWLASHGFTGRGNVPIVDHQIKEQMYEAYRVPFAMITGQAGVNRETITEEIRQAVIGYFS